MKQTRDHSDAEKSIFADRVWVPECTTFVDYPPVEEALGQWKGSSKAAIGYQLAFYTPA